MTDDIVEDVEAALESASKRWAYDEYWNAVLAKFVPGLLAALKDARAENKSLRLVIGADGNDVNYAWKVRGGYVVKTADDRYEFMTDKQWGERYLPQTEEQS